MVVSFLLDGSGRYLSTVLACSYQEQIAGYDRAFWHKSLEIDVLTVKVKNSENAVTRKIRLGSRSLRAVRPPGPRAADAHQLYQSVSRDARGV